MKKYFLILMVVSILVLVCRFVDRWIPIPFAIQMVINFVYLLVVVFVMVKQMRYNKRKSEEGSDSEN